MATGKGYGEVPGQIKAILCQPCLNQDKQTKAEKFCSTCNEFQCVDCLKGHYRYAYMKGHKLVNVVEMDRNQVSFDMNGLDQCNEHEEILKFFCEDKNKLCCSTCAIVDHRKCDSVVDVQKVVGKSALKNSRLKVILHEVKQKAEKIVYNVVESKKRLNEDVKEISSKIRRMRDEVIKMFDELEVSVVKDAKSLQKEEMNKLTKKQSENEKYLINIQSWLKTIDNVYREGTSVQQFIVKHRIKEEVNNLQAKVNAECQDSETVIVTFEFAETLHLPPLSFIDYVPGMLSLKYHLSDSARYMVPRVTKMRLSPAISVDLKQSDDGEREPLYTGIDFLPDGRLVAVDNKNKKCLVYNMGLEKVGSYQLNGTPLSVLAISKDEVVITSGGGYKLVILRVNRSNQIALDRTYKMTTKYDSICLINEEDFVVGTVDHSKPVRFISSIGEEKDLNINFPNKTYPVNTSACTYIRNSDKLVLTDRYEHTVYIYDIKTNTRVVVEDDQIKEPRGVTVGPDDTILVCSQNTNSIIQISQTGRILSSYKLNITGIVTSCVSRGYLFLAVTNSSRGEKKLQKLKIAL